jgi:preprotein translocase subunit SecA
MANDTATETGWLEEVWDQLSDKMNAASEWAARALMRVLGSSNERYVRKLGYIRNKDGTHTVLPGLLLEQVNELEPKMLALSDEDLKALTPKLRERLRQGTPLDDLLPEAFAACREAGRRTKNMRHFDVQILGGIVLHRGNIAEMVTGEGKTLVATLPAFLNALESKGVHVVTVNDYLARRDCEWMLPIYRALGLTAGYIQSDMDPAARRAAYDCDITYGTNSEFGFDYLRDNMKPARWADPNFIPWQQQCQKALHFAIIDEVDNILVDEARTPLIISGQAFSDIRRYSKANDIAVQLTSLQEGHAGQYFEVKEKEHTCHLTDEGVRKAEELAGVESFYTAGNMEWPHLIDNALKAHHLYKKDVRYAVMRHPETGEMSIIIIDEFTGRLMIGRQWSDGLHQAVEAKHARDGVKIKEETQTLATVTIQNYFKLYKKLAGMTGTAMTEANEFWKIYKLEVIAIPTNKPLRRINSPDLIYRTTREKWNAVIGEIVEEHGKHRPILIGTTDVDKSLKLSEMLKRRGIRHELLNALPEHAAREAEIVAQAGRLDSVTIATNMAGRGTDIILGGNPETLAWARLKDKYPTRLDVPEDEWKQTVEEIDTREKMKEEGRKVVEMGGLHIIGTERHEARRIDNQLRGRAGRQGDPGSSRFYVSLEDDLMRIFAGEWVANILTRLGMEEGQAIESKMVSRRIEGAQKKVEERNFDIRKNLLEYDEVMDHQRKRVYGYRQEILDGANCKVRILDMIDQVISLTIDRLMDDDYGPASFAEFASNRLGVEFDGADFARSDFTEAEKTARAKASRMVQTQVQEAIDENLGAEEEREWNWQALSQQVNVRWGLKTTDRQLKQMGKDNLGQFLIEKADAAIDAIDLSGGGAFLDEEWGLQSVCDWARLKFGIVLTVAELKQKEPAEVKELLHSKLLELYRQKEVEFPVDVGMARFMAEQRRQGGAGQRYDREGLYYWARERFPGLVVAPAENGITASIMTPSQDAGVHLTEEDFRTQSRSRLQEVLLQASRERFPKRNEEDIDAKVEDAFRGTRLSEKEDAQELVDWLRTDLGLEVPVEKLAGVTQEAARSVCWNAFDERYRPEMRGMERSLLLNQLDSGWKNHLYTMDHLRSVVGLRGFAQEDPKTVYKREGMKEFDTMWEGLQDKVTEAVFRMEEAEGFQESLWTIGATIHETAPRALPQPDENSMRGQQEAAIANSQKSEKKPEPIRNKGERVGRNDPCPCGSGKKYKNCHMREESGVRR